VSSTDEFGATASFRTCQRSIRSGREKVGRPMVRAWQTDRSKRDVGERRGTEEVGPLLGEAPGVRELRTNLRAAHHEPFQEPPVAVRGCRPSDSGLGPSRRLNESSQEDCR
jgi:hypothetical protein